MAEARCEADLVALGSLMRVCFGPTIEAGAERSKTPAIRFDVAGCSVLGADSKMVARSPTEIEGGGQ